MRGCKTLLYAGVLLLICAAAVLLAMSVKQARAHIPDHPELNDWMMSLKSQSGNPCCSEIDGSTVPDVDWDTVRIVNDEQRFRVHLGGEWIVVEPFQVVENPNRFGPAIVWIYYADGKPKVRCFLPGAGA
jgi:hypothetical protein